MKKQNTILPFLKVYHGDDLSETQDNEIAGRTYGKSHMQDLKSKIQRQSSKMLKDLNYGIVKKTYSGPKYTPKKKKRK